MGGARTGSGAMPMEYVEWALYHITGMKHLDGFAFDLMIDCAVGDQENLTTRMLMPCII